MIYSKKLILIMLLAINISCHKQLEDVHVTGQIIDNNDGSPLTNVKVSIFRVATTGIGPNGAEEITSMYTGPDGIFVLDFKRDNKEKYFVGPYLDYWGNVARWNGVIPDDFSIAIDKKKRNQEFTLKMPVYFGLELKIKSDTTNSDISNFCFYDFGYFNRDYCFTGKYIDSLFTNYILFNSSVYKLKYSAINCTNYRDGYDVLSINVKKRDISKIEIIY